MILVNDVTQFAMMEISISQGLSLVGCHVCGPKLLLTLPKCDKFVKQNRFLQFFRLCLFQFMNLQQSFYRHQDGNLRNSSQEQRKSM